MVLEESPTKQENSRASCVSRWFGQAISSPLGVGGEAKRRCLLQHDEGIPAVHDRVGIG